MRNLGLGLGLTRRASGGGANQLSDLFPDTVFEWDATNTASYDPVGDDESIINLTGDSAYDFWTGISNSNSNDPVFDSPDFVFDGGDRITLKGANTAYLNNIHKTSNTDGTVTFAFPIYVPADATATFFICGTANSSSESGFNLRFNPATSEWIFAQYNGGSIVFTTVLTQEPNLNEWNFFCLSIQKTGATSGNYACKLNNGAFTTGAMQTYGTTTADAGDELQISGVVGSAQLPNGARLTSFAIIDQYLSESDINSIASYYASRHSRSVYNQAPLSIQGVNSSAIIEIDPTNQSSFNGGTETYNIVPSPADGSNKGDHHFTFGQSSANTTGDPTSSGSGDTTAIVFNGSSYLTCNPISTFLDDIHKPTGGDVWIEMSFKLNTGPSSACLFATNTTASAEGIRLALNASYQLIFYQDAGGFTFANSGITLSQGVDYIVVVSHDRSANQTTFWVNSASGTQIAQTFNTSNSNNATAVPTIGAAGNFALGTRMDFYHLAIGNVALDDTSTQAIQSYVAGRQAEGRYSFL